MTRYDAIDEILDILRALSDFELVELHNDKVGYDDEIHFMADFNSDMADVSPVEIVAKCSGIDVDDTFYRFDAWGEAESTNDLESWWDLEEFVEDLIDDDEDLGYDNIRNILDSIKEEDEEEEQYKRPRWGVFVCMGNVSLI